MSLSDNTTQLQSVLTMVNDLPNAIPYSEKGVANGVATLNSNGALPLEQRPTPNIITASDISQIALIDYCEIYLTDITSLELFYPEGNFEVWFRIIFADAGDVSVTFPDETRYIGAKPEFGNGETWEISIKDGVAICWRVE